MRDSYKKLMPMKKMTGEEELQHILAVKCFLCGRRFHESDELSKKQADHCHITGKYREPACKYCNLMNLLLIGIPIPIIFHNFSGYDSKLIMQNVRDMSISVTASQTEKIKCATIFVQDIVDDVNEESEQGNNVFTDDMASDGDEYDVAEETPRKTGRKQNKSTISFIDSFAFLNSSPDNLSSILDDSDKQDLDSYIAYKCLSKFQSKEEMELS